VYPSPSSVKRARRPERRSPKLTYHGAVEEGKPMGERSRGKDKGKAKKAPKAVKVGRRPHELQQQLRDALKRPSGGSA